MSFASVQAVRNGEALTLSRGELSLTLGAARFPDLPPEVDASATMQEANLHYNAGNAWSDEKEHERALVEYRRAIAMNRGRFGSSSRTRRICRI